MYVNVKWGPYMLLLMGCEGDDDNGFLQIFILWSFLFIVYYVFESTALAYAFVDCIQVYNLQQFGDLDVDGAVKKSEDT